MKLHMTALAMSILFLTAPLVAQEPATQTAPSETEPSEATEVPMETLREMESLFRPKSQPTSREELSQMLEKQFEEVLEISDAIQKEYPEANNLFLVRAMALRAAAYLSQINATPERNEQLSTIAQDILENPGPAQVKAQAEYMLMELEFGQEAPENKQVREKIQKFVQTYQESDAEAVAMIYAVLLARRAGANDLKDQYATTLQEEYASRPDVVEFLAGIGKGPKFSATLTRLDGSELRLPDDLKGKVVVIDFWATWCGPCIQTLPEMRNIYSQYDHSKVEFVGISLDRPDQLDDLKEFVKDKQLNWIHTYSGEYWDDPTAQKYGIRSIPSIWVLDAEGKIVSTNARGRLKQVIDQALQSSTEIEPQTPTTQPSGS